MHEIPDDLSDRPGNVDFDADVMGDVLNAVHLTTAIFGRLELGAPWRLRVPAREYLSFYAVAAGQAWLEVDEPDERARRPISLAAGDAVVLPRGSAHLLGDADRSHVAPIDFDYVRCPTAWAGQAARFGGAGAETVLLAGHFTFGATMRNALLASLPPAIHLPADAANAPQLTGVVPLILRESAVPGPGTSIVLARLADLLLIQSLRHWIAATGTRECGLRAVSDPAIGAALRAMHAHPAESWTVERLASSVAMSRSAFAARFTALVGEPPLQYLARWRMTTAARLLTEGDESVAAVAERVGYANPVAFTKAFTRIQGIGPGAVRHARGATGKARPIRRDR